MTDTTALRAAAEKVLHLYDEHDKITYCHKTGDIEAVVKKWKDARSDLADEASEIIYALDRLAAAEAVVEALRKSDPAYFDPANRLSAQNIWHAHNEATYDACQGYRR